MEGKKRRLGVREIARRTGRSAGHVCRVLRGERRPGEGLARALRRLGVEVEGA